MAALTDLFGFESNPWILFSQMKSKPKQVDVKPRSVLVWSGAQNRNLGIFEIPRYSVVTSRADSPSTRQKRAHYALVCYSDVPLCKSANFTDVLDAATLANLRTGKRLGASQVTAVVSSQVFTEAILRRSPYPVSITARLSTPGQVRLTHPTMLREQTISALRDVARTDNVNAWRALVDEIKAEHPPQSRRGHLPEGQRELSLG